MKNGAYNGSGTLVKVNGDSLNGNFKNGEFIDGYVTITDESSGDVYTGNYVNGKY
jgi:hypothetical protein